MMNFLAMLLFSRQGWLVIDLGVMPVLSRRKEFSGNIGEGAVRLHGPESAGQRRDQLGVFPVEVEKHFPDRQRGRQLSDIPEAQGAD